MGVDHKVHTFFGHEIHTPLNDVNFVRFHVGHAVHHEAADPVSALKDGDRMAHLV